MVWWSGCQVGRQAPWFEFQLYHLLLTLVPQFLFCKMGMKEDCPSRTSSQGEGETAMHALCPVCGLCCSHLPTVGCSTPRLMLAASS